MKIFIDGEPADIQIPTTGMLLHMKAGDPIELTTNGSPVTKTGQPFEITEGQEFTTRKV